MAALSSAVYTIISPSRFSAPRRWGIGPRILASIVAPTAAPIPRNTTQ